jgi:hypothetical protein
MEREKAESVGLLQAFLIQSGQSACAIIILIYYNLLYFVSFIQLPRVHAWLRVPHRREHDWAAGLDVQVDVVDGIRATLLDQYNK